MLATDLRDAAHRGRRGGCRHGHFAVDDHSRRADAEVLPTDRRRDALTFLERALCWYRAQGVALEK